MIKIRGKGKASKPAKKTTKPSGKKKAATGAVKKRTSGTKSLSPKSAPKKKSPAQTKARSPSKTARKKSRAVKKTAPAGKKGTVSKLKTSSQPKVTKKPKAAGKKSPAAKKAAASKKKSPATKKNASKKPPSLKSAAKKSTKAATPATKTAKLKRTTTAKSSSAKKKAPVRPPFTAYKGIRPYLFTSYAHKNMKEVFHIIKKLSSSRFRIWYDEGIEPGNEWPEVVGSAIVNCAQFLVFMSPHAADSRNVRNEINLAFSENKDIIVIFVQRTNLSEGMKLQIGTVQFINRFELTDREFFEKLTKVLSNALRN